MFNYKYFIFIFKRRYRNFFLGNFAKTRKIKNFIIINLSGPVLSVLGKFFYFLFKKKIIFISCDGESFLFDKNAVNIWMGGTSKKIDPKYLQFKNNYVTSSNLFTNRSKVLQIYPENFFYRPLNKNFKFIYASTFVQPSLKKSSLIWFKYKNIIMNNTNIINDGKFWLLLKKFDNKDFFRVYIDLKNFIRFEYIKILKKNFPNRLLLIGSDWKKYYPSSIDSNFSNNFINVHYAGNIGLDFGSRDGDEIFYPRSIQIIENNALLIQSRQNCLNQKFSILYRHISFKNPRELVSKLCTFAENTKYANDILKKIVYFFNKKNYNLKSLKKITNL